MPRAREVVRKLSFERDPAVTPYEASAQERRPTQTILVNRLPCPAFTDTSH